MEDANCKTCLFWQGRRCKRYPPVGELDQPQTLPTDTCGEWRPAEGEDCDTEEPEGDYYRHELERRLNSLEQFVGRIPRDMPEVGQAQQTMQAQIDQLVENTTRLKQMVIALQQQRTPDYRQMVETAPFGPDYMAEVNKRLAENKDPRTAKRRRAVDSAAKEGRAHAAVGDVDSVGRVRAVVGSAARRPAMKKKPKKPGKKC